MRYVVVLSLSTWPDKFISNDHDRIVSLDHAIAWAERHIGRDTTHATIYKLQGYAIVQTFVLSNGTWQEVST